MASSRAGRLLLPLLCACAAALEEAGASAGWTTHQGLNCWDGDKGGIRLRVEELPYHNPVHDTDELEEMSLEDCRDRCALDASCEAILTIHRHVEAGQPPEGPCWFRRNLTIGACVTGTPWDLHVLQGRNAFVVPASVPAPAPAPVPFPETRAKPPFDCRAGLAQWEDGWSDPKKEYCCSVEGVHCGQTLPTYDCTAAGDDWKAWAIDKQAWCCEHVGVACESADFDCNAGRWNWMAGWSKEKKAYCCSVDGVSCGDVGLASYQADVGVPLWLLNLLLLVLFLLLVICLVLICLFYAGCLGRAPRHAATTTMVRQPVSEPLVVKKEPVKKEEEVQTETVIVKKQEEVQTETVVVEPAVQVVVETPTAVAAVDTNPDGTIDALVIGDDRNKDGIPDVLQQVVVVEEKPPPPVQVIQPRPVAVTEAVAQTPVMFTERVFYPGDHVLAVEAPGYGPMIVTQSDRATADPLRGHLDYSYGRLMNQFALSGPRRYY